MTATHELNELKDILVKLYPDAKFEYIDNPRQEKAENTLKVKNDNFKDLGYVGIEVNEADLRSLVEVCRKYPERFQQNSAFIKPISFWNKQKP